MRVATSVTASRSRARRRLLLVKHSLPEIAPDRARQEWRLCDEGRERCARLAALLATHAPERIVTSPEPKADATGRAVAAILDVGVEVRPALHEQDDRDVPFLGEAPFRAAVARFFARPAEAVFGRETADEAHERFSRAIAEIGEPSEGRSVVAVAHGRVISLFVARRNGLDAFALWARLGSPSFVVLDLPGYGMGEVVEEV